MRLNVAFSHHTFTCCRVSLTHLHSFSHSYSGARNCKMVQCAEWIWIHQQVCGSWTMHMYEYASFWLPLWLCPFGKFQKLAIDRCRCPFFFSEFYMVWLSLQKWHQRGCVRPSGKEKRRFFWPMIRGQKYWDPSPLNRAFCDIQIKKLYATTPFSRYSYHSSW